MPPISANENRKSIKVGEEDVMNCNSKQRSFQVSSFEDGGF